MVSSTHTITQTAQETQSLGERIGSSLVTQSREGTHVFCLWGELGSGKTTFTQGLARGLGITSRLLSPTFIIVRRYHIPETSRMLYHLDLYRLGSAKEVEALGFPDMITDPDAIVIIEWPERLGNHIPKERIDIKFETLPNGEHQIEGTNF